MMAAASSASSNTMTSPPPSRHGGGDGASVKAPHPSNPTHFHAVFSHALVTPAVLQHRYKGGGTAEDPFLVEFLAHDPRNPMLFSPLKRWSLIVLMGVATLAVTFNSSAYSGGVPPVIRDLGTSEEVSILGVSLFVLGFAIGPLFWGPLSELYGRQALFIITYGALTAFLAGAGGAPNIQTLVILRFFAGAFGSSPLTNAGGVIADMFPARERGLAVAIFAIAPFMGPALGPIVGGFVAQTIGWRWLEWILALFSAAVWIAGTLFMPETYAPVLLRARAARLAKLTGRAYVSILEKRSGPKPSLAQALRTALSRPWIFLIREPIVTIITVYMAIVYGTLYMMFAAFPIVFQEGRGWSGGVGGLAFIGIAVGILLALAYIIPDNKRFERVGDAAVARGEPGAPPEARLPPSIVGSVLLPVGLFWFAWTNGPEVHWIVPIIASAPFGAGMILVFLSCLNYLIDSYTVYAASVLAANSVLRSLFGAAFPLFTTQMYANLGVHWASSIPAFLALACVPFPFLFYRYGAPIRQRCKYSSQAMEIMAKIRESEHVNQQGKKVPEKSEGAASDADQDVEVGDVRKETAAGEKVVEQGAHSSADSLRKAKSQTGTSLRPIRSRNDGDHISIDPTEDRPECRARPEEVDGTDMERVRTGRSIPY